MDYKFYGWEHADAPAITDEFSGIKTPIDLYDALSDLWCGYTCAPRMRGNWTKENKTLGQCSITAFLAQDIFGGKVYGICGMAESTTAIMWFQTVCLTLPASSSGMKC